MQMYNSSLRYAEKGSKNVSLAYANILVLFFKLMRYHERLFDIDLAKEAGYPEKLMPKLDQRREHCSLNNVQSISKMELNVTRVVHLMSN